MSWHRALFNTADAYGKPRETAKDSLKLPKFLSSRLLAKWHSLSWQFHLCTGISYHKIYPNKENPTVTFYRNYPSIEK